MSRTRMLLTFAVTCLVPSAMAAQVPPELREAMRARDEAVAKADAATWDRFTTDDFTVVLADGTLLTKAERRRNKSRSSTTATFSCVGPYAS